MKFTFTTHYHFGERQKCIRPVTGGADGDAAEKVDTLTDRHE